MKTKDVLLHKGDIFIGKLTQEFYPITARRLTGNKGTGQLVGTDDQYNDETALTKIGRRTVSPDDVSTEDGLFLKLSTEKDSSISILATSEKVVVKAPRNTEGIDRVINALKESFGVPCIRRTAGALVN